MQLSASTLTRPDAWLISSASSSARVTAQYAAPQVKVSKMKIERLFRVAPSIVRMILKERLTATYVVEGYLRSTPERTQLVRLEPNGCHLLLQRLGDQKRTEERTKLPTEQAEALLDVSGGRVGYRRTLVRVDNERDANLDRFEQPAGLELVTVEFDDERQAGDCSRRGARERTSFEVEVGEPGRRLVISIRPRRSDAGSADPACAAVRTSEAARHRRR